MNSRALIPAIALIGLFFFNMKGQVIWGPAMNLAAFHFDNNHPRITVDGSGNPLIIWGRSDDVLFTRWTGNEFTQPVKLNPASQPAASADWMGPDLAAHGDTVYIAYKQTPENQASSPIWVIRSPDGGITWGDPVAIENVNDEKSRFSAVTTDDMGNPIVAYMQFDPDFLEARWVVARSWDQGQTFSPAVKASGWSSSESEVCDCCPGEVLSEGDIVTVLYRNNDDNLRDTWAGVSTDGGLTFTGGINLDQQNWTIFACPASGPDGVIINGLLYSTFMNGASGNAVVYHSEADINALSSTGGQPATNTSSGLSQNFPRIAHHNQSVAMIWRHAQGPTARLGLHFTPDITNGFSSTFDTIAISSVVNGDVAMTKDKIYVIWQDNVAGIVKFRQGQYTETTSTRVTEPNMPYSIYPNPVRSDLVIAPTGQFSTLSIRAYDQQGRLIHSRAFKNVSANDPCHLEWASVPNGLYFISLDLDGQNYWKKIVKQ